MADMSLDDIIKKNKVNVRIQKPAIQNKRKLFTQKNRQGVSKSAPPQTQVKHTFDARHKLGSKLVLDARDKIIINKKTGKGDARNRIVHQQVKKGTFDARSLIQRQAEKTKGQGKNGGPQAAPAPDGGFPQVTRTLANPNAKGRAQVQVTNHGLQITRPVPSTQVSLSSNSLQVTKRTQNRSAPPPTSGFVPVIQIRNDRYKRPAEAPELYGSQQQQQFQQAPTGPKPQFLPYESKSYPNLRDQYSSQNRGYIDLDNPEHNTASAVIPEIPRVQITNNRPVEHERMRPVSNLTRSVPGAASLSQNLKLSQPKTMPQHAPLKLAPTGVKRRQPPQEVSGPLRLGKGGGPGIDLGGVADHSVGKRSKLNPVKVETEDADDSADVISPLQGFRVMVTNLFNGVTQDDIIELFGAVGPLKKAKLLKPGAAEVVYVTKNDAVSAVQKYHSRELDGQPMYVKMTTPVTASVKSAMGDHDPDITGEALRLYKKGSGIGSLPEAPIEIPTIHRALFKAGPPGPNKSVKFTVKI